MAMIAVATQEDRVQFGSPRKTHTGFYQSAQTSRISLSPDENAVFIPKFADLRQKCLEHTEAKLRAVEARIHAAPDGSVERSQALDQASGLLEKLDNTVRSEVLRQQMEDPEWASSRGISIVHFGVGSRLPHGGQWMMLTCPSGRDSTHVVEHDKSRLSGVLHSQLQNFAGDQSDLAEVYYKRRKTVAERQPGSIATDEHGRMVPKPLVVFAWRVVLLLAALALILFLGVGIIATNSTFDATFQKYFFWIAIVWVLVSSSLLAWLVQAVGGSKKDIVSGALAVVAIWLVVIQIGQTHLVAQQSGLGD
ncbi:MAG: hypothetical protein M1833_005733 [Piccolia ochrophora]|nr:MAG: hypothetical protein M1833_005733 [Piccolia ochrophora]